ncbi:MAG: NUDIX domain-containing protein [Myxococcota bacterium]
MGLVSAGLLVYRNGAVELEVFLAHPGGPYFARKDEGSWTVPKGAPLEGEALIAAARREFEEEIGFAPSGDLHELGSIKQRSGKLVHAWCVEASLPPGFTLKSNEFELEWPPGSGKRKLFPEVDRAAFFPFRVALTKIMPAQKPFLERLAQRLSPATETGDE